MTLSNDSWNDDRESSATLLERPLPTWGKRGLWASLLLGGVIFASGAVVGGAVMRATRTDRPPVRSPGEIPARLASRMQQQYGLTEDQRSKIEVILRDHQRSLRRIAKRIAPDARRELDRSMGEICGLLTPEQAQSWRTETMQRLGEFFPSLREPSAPPPEKQ